MRVLTMSEFCSWAKCSRSTAYKAIAAGRLKVRKNGRSTVILIEDAEEWLASLPTYKSPPQGDPSDGSPPAIAA